MFETTTCSDGLPGSRKIRRFLWNRTRTDRGVLDYTGQETTPDGRKHLGFTNLGVTDYDEPKHNSKTVMSRSDVFCRK